MARGKKNEKELTIEERLERALVPAEEQPYSVPENWCWVKVGALSTLHRGVSYKKHDVHFVKQENDCLILRGGNINEGSIDVDQSDNVYVDMALVDKEQLIQEYDVVIVSSTGSTRIIGRAGISHDSFPDVAFGAFLTLIRPTSDKLKPFIAYYFQTDLYRERIRNLAAGVNINNIRADYITESPVPFPPHAEQQRIVDRIESLFAKLDEAQEKAQAVVDGFETRRAAILHKAFTGELTEKWRQENNTALSSWENVPFDECILKMQNGLAKRNGTSGSLFVVLRLANLSDDGFNTEDLREILLDEKEQLNYALRQSDVIMIRVNGSKDNVGKQFLITTQKNWAFCDHIIRIVYKETIQPKYMIYFSKSEKYRFYVKENMVSSAGQNTISRKGMSKLIVPLPALPEQEEIVSILDNLLNKEQQAKETAEAVLDQIEAMKKSILARAFRGELGTNDPAEESGVELLKQGVS